MACAFQSPQFPIPNWERGSRHSDRGEGIESIRLHWLYGAHTTCTGTNSIAFIK
jgi:hypothetical protein